VISGFTLNGINVTRADTVVSELSVKDSIIRNALPNGRAVFLQNSSTGRVQAVTGTTSALNAEDVVVTFNQLEALFVGDGDYAGGMATARMSNTQLTESGTGVQATTNGTAYLAFCTVTGNGKGLFGAGARVTLGNNRIFNNILPQTPPAFTSTIPQQ